MLILYLVTIQFKSLQIDQTELLQENKYENDQLIEKQQQIIGQSSYLFTFFSLINSIIGTGILTLPYCLLTDGYALGIGFFIITSIISHITMFYISELAEESNLFTYNEIAQHILKQKFWQYPIFLLTILYKSGKPISQLILIMDNMYWWQSQSSHKYKIIALICAAYLILYPLACLKSYRLGKSFRNVTVFFIIILAVIIVTYYFQFDKPHDPPQLISDGFKDFKTLPLISSSLSAHFAMPHLYKNLNSRSVKKMRSIIVQSALFLLPLYGLIMVFGYLTFTNLLQSDLLKTIAQYAAGTWDLEVANILQIIITVFNSSSTPNRQRAQYEKIIWGDVKPPWWAKWALGFGIISLYLSLALLIPTIANVLDITSSLAGSLLIFSVPALLKLIILRQRRGKAVEYLLPCFILCFGMFIMVTGFTSTIMTW